jgi:hypothetical protein
MSLRRSVLYLLALINPVPRSALATKLRLVR